MLGIIGIAIMVLGLAILLWHTSRRRPTGQAPGDRRAIVSPDDAAAALYPYVFVSDRGSVRELHASEKLLLETPFHALDSGRPYVKRTHDQKNARGGLSGYCLRSEIPRRMAIGYPPIEIERPAQTRTPQPTLSRLARTEGVNAHPPH